MEKWEWKKEEGNGRVFSIEFACLSHPGAAQNSRSPLHRPPSHPATFLDQRHCAAASALDAHTQHVYGRSHKS